MTALTKHMRVYI